MTDREDNIYKSILEILIRELNPHNVIMFGSRAKETANPSSDFDFAIDCDSKLNGLKRKVLDAIDKISGLYTVDIIYLDEVDEGFKDIILKTGKVVYARRN